MRALTAKLQCHVCTLLASAKLITLITLRCCTAQQRALRLAVKKGYRAATKRASMISVSTGPGSTGTAATAAATATAGTAGATAAASSGPNSPALATNRAATLVDSFMSYMSPSSRKLSQQQPQSSQLFSSSSNATATTSSSGGAKQGADVAVTSPPGGRGSVSGLSQVSNQQQHLIDSSYSTVTAPAAAHQLTCSRVQFVQEVRAVRRSSACMTDADTAVAVVLYVCRHLRLRRRQQQVLALAAAHHSSSSKAQHLQLLLQTSAAQQQQQLAAVAAAAAAQQRQTAVVIAVLQQQSSR
jgi:hypothetical protein